MLNQLIICSILHHEGTKDTNDKLKKINHKGHKELKGREARKIKFQCPLPFDFAQRGE
jgi:hypothetical protein